jgi:hypothetical protein
MQKASGSLAQAVRIALAASVLAALASPGSATVRFSNTGTTSGWDSTYVEHNGTVAQVSSPAYKGTTAIRFRQIYDSSYTGRYHAEVRKNNMAQNGMEQRYYGYAFYLPSNWQFVSQNYNFGQFITNYYSTDAGECRTAGVPITMHQMLGNVLRTRTISGDTCNEVQTSWDVATVTAGTWHRLLLRATWRSDTTGAFKVWYDGSVKVDVANVATILKGTKQFTFVAGLYANGWHDDGKMVGTQGTRELYVDQVAIATVYAEANPSDW